MKNVVTIDVVENNNLKTIPFIISEVVLDGLYVTVNQRDIRTNLKKFNIKKELSKGSGQIGIKFSKVNELTIVTINIKHQRTIKDAQFLVHNSLTEYQINNAYHPSLIGLKDVLIDALKISKINNMQDLLNLLPLIDGKTAS